MANYVSKGYTTPAGVDSREDVRKWQQRLGVTADGIWGKNTQAAYQQWQRDIRNSSAGANPTAPVSIGGSKQSGASYSAGAASYSGSAAKQQLTAQQKNAAFSGSWWERIGNTLSNLTGNKTAADPLPTPKQNYAVMSVNGIGAQYASGKTKAKQTAAPKKTYPLSEYEYPMHSTGAGGIGGQMNADKIAAAVEEKKQRQQQYITNPNPFTAKSSNYGTLGGWQTSMPVGEKPEEVKYTGGLGGGKYFIDKMTTEAPIINVALDASQVTPEEIAEAEREKAPYQFKLQDTIAETDGITAYNEKLEEREKIIGKEPTVKTGPAYDPDAPLVESMLEKRSEWMEEKQAWENRMMRGNGLDARLAAEMVEECNAAISAIDDDIAKLVYVLPDEVLRNEFGAQYADLLCLRVVEREDADRIRQALDELDTIRLTCYIKGDYGRSAAAEDILTALTYKLPETTFGAAIIYDRGLHIPQVMHASGMVAEKGNVYQQTLNNMAGEQNMRLANPQGYGAAVAASGIYDLAKLPYNLITRAGSFVRSTIAEEVIEKFARNVSDYLYQQAEEG